MLSNFQVTIQNKVLKFSYLVTSGRAPAAPPPGLSVAVVTLMLLQLLSTEIFRD